MGLSRNTALLAFLVPLAFVTCGVGRQNILAQQTEDTHWSTAPAQITTLHVSSKVVLVDVSVTDSSGHPIRGLKASDFSLTENNKPQHIRAFDEHTQPAPGTYPPNPKLPKLGTDVFTNYTPVPPSGSLTIVLLDMLNTPFREQSIVRAQLLTFLNSVPPDQRVAIFGLTDHLLLLQGFTSNPEVLKVALKKSSQSQLSRMLDDAANGTQVAAGAEANPDLYGNDPGTIQTLQALRDLETEVAGIQQQIRTQDTLDAIDLLARYLSGMSGRKNILWFSSSFPSAITFNDTGDGSALTVASGLENQIKRTTNLLSACQAAIYPIDAEGLSGPGIYSASGSRSSKGAAQAINLSNAFQSTATGHASMSALAQDTGGQAFFNTNGLKEAAAKAMEVGSNFYSLAYTSADKTADGGFRRIDVKIAGKQYHLAYRSGYYADKPGLPSAAEDAPQAFVPKSGTLSAALMRGAPNPTEILFKVRAQPARSDEATPAPGNDVDARVHGPFRRYLIDFGADIHNVEAQPLPDDLHHLSMEFVTLVYDQDNAVINSVSNTIAGNFPKDSYQQALKTGMKFSQVVSIPVKGEYTLRVAVRDTLSNRLGTVEIPVARLVEIPADTAPAPTPAKP
jgi:VWFA-related protein